MTVRKYSQDDYGYYARRYRAGDNSVIIPDWDSSLVWEFYDGDDVLQFTATIDSDPDLVEDSDSEGSFIKVSGIPLSDFALGLVTVNVYSKKDGVEIEPYPTIATAFQVIEGGVGYATDVAHVRDVANLPDAIDSEIILAHFPAARRRIKRWVGAAAYADAIAEAPEDSDRAEAIRDAEARLVIHYGLTDWSRRIGQAGNFQSGSDGGQSSWLLKTTADLTAEADRNLQLAEDAVGDYLTDPAPTIHKVEAEDYSDED